MPGSRSIRLSLPGGTVGVPYSQTVSATGGTGTYTFSVSAGTLPAGLSLNAVDRSPVAAHRAAPQRAISPSPPRTATVRRDHAATASRSMRRSRVNPATLSGGTVGVAYSQSVSAAGGTGSYTFSVSAGSLPAGLSLNAATGAIRGTPSSAATSTFTVTATDGNGATGSRAYTVTINAAITRQSGESAQRDDGQWPTAQTVSATGGNGSLCLQRQFGSAACRPHTECVDRRDHRNTCRSGDEQLHDHRHGRQRRDRIAALQCHDQCGALR